MNAYSSTGSLYENDLNPFEVLGLPADQSLTCRGIRYHLKTVVKHVFERGVQPALTRGPNVPTWAQVNAAKDRLSTPHELTTLLAVYKNRTNLRWNPLAQPGSAAALLPPVGGFIRTFCF